MARPSPPAEPQLHAIEHARLTLRTAAELITRQAFYRKGVGFTDSGTIGEGFKGHTRAVVGKSADAGW